MEHEDVLIFSLYSIYHPFTLLSFPLKGILKPWCENAAILYLMSWEVKCDASLSGVTRTM